MIQSLTGSIHLAASIIALLTGAIVFFLPKAGAIHKRIGYVYVVSMIIVIITAFMIYRLTGGFNILHIAAVVSGIPLTLGMKAVIFRRWNSNWFLSHYENMCWSYIGLFAAFVAETSVRIIAPFIAKTVGYSIGWWFWAIVGLSTFLVCLIGDKIIKKNLELIKAYKESKGQ